MAGGLLLALSVAAVLVEMALHRVEPFLRAHIVEALENRFHARVELDSFHVSLVNGLWAEGKGLRIWPPAEVNGVAVPEGQGEPLIRLDEFRFHAPLRYRPGEAIHVSVVELKGLNVNLPPRSHFEHQDESAGGADHTLAATGRNAGPSTALSAKNAPNSAQDDKRNWGAQMVSFDVDRIECSDADLVMETSKPGKLPLEFLITRLTLTNIASGGAIGFDAQLTNPRPRGTIYAQGSFGPWLADDPGESLLQGDYRLEHANLASFNGIAGTLDSTGRYQGTLRSLTVDGETRTPDFSLTHFGNTLPLTTHFHALVDGTNGDTQLEPVDATLGRSHFTAQGTIARVPEAMVGGARQYGGHQIALDVDVDRARIEDFLRLAGSTDKVLMTGDVRVKTKLLIPPGPAPIHERLKLDGWFALDKALFTSEKIQGRILELSLRGQGRPNEVKTADPASILSQMESNFQLAGGIITLPALSYTVPGAAIQLKGTYRLEGGALNFDGTAKMEASVSKMVGGWKGMLLKPADRFLKKNGAGTEVGVQIKGTREEPKFGIDFNLKK